MTIGADIVLRLYTLRMTEGCSLGTILRSPFFLTTKDLRSLGGLATKFYSYSKKEN
jgi:hypothetical protein